MKLMLTLVFCLGTFSAFAQPVPSIEFESEVEGVGLFIECTEPANMESGRAELEAYCKESGERVLATGTKGDGTGLSTPCLGWRIASWCVDAE